MNDILHIGQWQGFFRYGPEYGELLEGQEAEFRLFVEECGEGQFAGRIIDWEGVGANGEVATVHGFITKDLISFTKKYSAFHGFDEDGDVVSIEDVEGHCVEYEGRFDAPANSFSGTWEIRTEIGMVGDKIIEEVATGSWRMACTSE